MIPNHKIQNMFLNCSKAMSRSHELSILRSTRTRIMQAN